LRPTVAEVDLSAVAFNIESIKNKVAPAEIMAVVKANAYGHGALEISRTAIQHGIKYLGVASVEEGVELRKAGIDIPILVFSGLSLNQASLYLENNLEATIFDKIGFENLRQAAMAAHKQAVAHIKIDTGMGRVGIDWRSAADFIEKIVATEAVQIKAVYTHFANSDHLDKSYALLQLARFKQVLDRLKEKKIDIPLKHAANSGAILNIPESYFDLVRPGITIYGYYPSNTTLESIPLKPVLSFKTRVLYLKEVDKGESISYDRTFLAPRATRVATIPAGYADGYNRLLSNQGHVLINGEFFPVIGRVTMDLLMVDVGEKDVQIGDEVILLGKQGGKEITIQSICEKLNTIPYEVLCSISHRVPRIYRHREDS